MMETKNILKLIGLYILLLLGGTVGFVLSFHLGFLKQMDVFFYRGLLLILIWGTVISLLMWTIRWTKKIEGLSFKDVILLFVLFCSIHTVLFTHLPVTAERSISVFMLGYMADHQDESYTQEEIEHFFIDKYVKEYGAFEKRFHEQEVTGTIEKTDEGRYKISGRGISLMKLYEIIAGIFNINMGLIHPS